MIKREMLLIELIQQYPSSVIILSDYGMNCSGCLGVSTETLEDAARAHGVNVDDLIWDLTKAVEQRG